ncbi:MAG: flagellar FliJ family protein [Rhodothermales bacterium]
MAGKKFRFSLESVLKLRRYETERARQHLGRAALDRQQQQEQVRHRQQRLMRLDGSATGVVEPESLRRQAAFRSDAQRHYDQARDELDARRHREGQAREHLRTKHSGEESLQILREQEAAQHKKAQDHAEDAFLDEQAIAGFIRKRRA